MTKLFALVQSENTKIQTHKSVFNKPDTNDMIISVRLSLKAFEENIFWNLHCVYQNFQKPLFLGAFVVISIHIYINRLCN